MSWCKCPLVGMTWCECPFVGMQWRKCSFVHAMMRMSLCAWHDANAPYRDAINVNVLMMHAMMRMSAWEYAIMRMSHWCMPWCECPLSMQWMWMPAWVCNECKCLLESMPWYECPLGNMPWGECLFVGIPWHECFDANTIYSKIPFIFKTRLPQRLKPKYSQNLIYYSWKVIFLLT